MTNVERDYIIRYRQAGKSCAEIARILGLSANTVKSFCQRNNIVPIMPNTQASLPTLSETVCLCCGEKVTQQPHRKPKRFCSDACRLRWWHAHRDMEKKCRRPPLLLLRARVSFFAGTKILQPRLLYQSEIWRESAWAQC